MENLKFFLEDLATETGVLFTSHIEIQKRL